MNIHKRYEEDPAFRNLVDLMQAEIERGSFTPTEIREAAMVAQILYEERHPRPRRVSFTLDDIRLGKV